MFWKSKPWRSPVPSSSVSGASTLMTRAPISLSWRTHVGPERALVRSTTLICDSALAGGGSCILEHYVTNDGSAFDGGVRLGDALERQPSADDRPERMLLECSGDVRRTGGFGGLRHGIDQDGVHVDVLLHQRAKRDLRLRVATRC